ncbi:hypothetical protein ACHAW5_001976 [Stephanodiscus triporus]|uniref:4a-hydroxytetrahydrobiopterin dehydratase n=1 Tax=Stephanodiscus triporus TaxID=2934178 RepID=A0ABD3QRK9_9STRA
MAGIIPPSMAIGRAAAAVPARFLFGIPPRRAARSLPPQSSHHRRRELNDDCRRRHWHTSNVRRHPPPPDGGLRPLVSTAGGGDFDDRPPPSSDDEERFRLPSASASAATRDDPTAGRPTRKCDPYGLGGGSLSIDECSTWMSTLEGGWRLMYDTTEDEDVDDDVVVSRDYDLGAIAGGGYDSNETVMEEEGRQRRPSSLRKEFFHPAFVDAARFAHIVSLIATNVDHFPHLSVERILTTDVDHPAENITRGRKEGEDVDDDESGAIGGGGGGGGRDGNNTDIDDDDGTTDDSASSRERRRNRTKGAKLRGWIFRSIVSCSTRRPPVSDALSSSSASSSPPSSRGHRWDGGDEYRRRRRHRGLTYHDFHLAMCIDVEAKRDDDEERDDATPKGRRDEERDDATPKGRLADGSDGVGELIAPAKSFVYDDDRA